MESLLLWFMVKKSVLAVLLLSPLLVAVSVAPYSVPVAASPSIIRVPDDYRKIQEAVNAANSGDIVLVSAGTYYEHVRVNKTISLVGQSREATIIDGNRAGDVLYVTADNVKISGFTVQNGGGLGVYLGCGLVLERCNGNTIYANTIASNVFGVWLEESLGNMITGNRILNNGVGPGFLMHGAGIVLGYSNSNIINHNYISSNVVGGISLSSSYNNIVNHNTVTKNVEAVFLVSSPENIIGDNIVASNDGGIEIRYSAKNTIRRNQIFKNEGGGIGVLESEMNIIRENNVTENKIGIGISHRSPNNTFVGNTISNNLNGIKIHYSNGSVIHHNNFINNTVNAPEDVYPNVNTWDDDYPSGGNYWSDYLGADLYNGPHRNLKGSDGIGDTPHTLDPRNKDRFPLMGPISLFDAGPWNGTSREVHVASNSTISNFQLNKTQKTISFNVTGSDYTVGFCRVTIPNIIVQDLWGNNYTVLVDGNPPLMTNNCTDGTYTYIYFTYPHSQHEVVIIPEFPTALLLPLFITITPCAVTLRRRKTKP